MRIRNIIVAGLLGVIGVGPAAADELWGVDASSDSLYRFDSRTGAMIGVVGPLHPDSSRYTTPVAMAVRAIDGAIYVVNNSPVQDEGLSVVDPETGRATLVLDERLGAITFDAFGTLYSAGGELSIVNPDTGAIISLGGDALPTFYGLEYNRDDGLLYGVTWSVGARAELLKVDPATGLIVDRFEIDRDMPAAPGSLVYTRAGNLLCSTIDGGLFRVGTTDGSVSNERSSVGAQGMGRVKRDCDADIDGDGDVDSDDFFGYLDLFAIGCP